MYQIAMIAALCGAPAECVVTEYKPAACVNAQCNCYKCVCDPICVCAGETKLVTTTTSSPFKLVAGNCANGVCRPQFSGNCAGGVCAPRAAAPAAKAAYRAAAPRRPFRGVFGRIVERLRSLFQR